MNNNNQLLQAYKKSNKTRRLRIIELAGFKDEASYLLSLTATIAPIVTVKPKSNRTNSTKKVHIVYIIDASYSMNGSKLTAACNGIKDELKEFSNNNTSFTIVSFSDRNDIRYHAVDSTTKNIQFNAIPARNMTALYDSICTVIDSLNVKESKSQILIKIFTDGRDNHSFKGVHIASDYIQYAEKHGATVTFVGTKDDVEYVQNNLKVDESNTLVHENTGASVKMSFNRGLAATITYMDNVQAGLNVTKGFYKKTGKL